MTVHEVCDHLGLTWMHSEMLTDMHDKLSQAVKLYDSILTDQVRHCSSPLQQQTIPSSSNKYNQWIPVPPTSQISPQQYALSPQQLMQRHNQPQSPVVATQSVGSPPMQRRSQSLASAPHHPQNQAYAPAPPSMAAIASTSQSQSQMSSQNTHHWPPVSYASTSQHQQGAHLRRSSTVAHPGFQPTLHQIQSPYHQQQRPLQQQHQHQEVPSSLPQFPHVPTVAPMYDTTIHSGVMQNEERKEAMLIDL